MRIAVLHLIGMSLAGVTLLAQQRYAATGLILEIDGESQTITVSHQTIPGFMPAMAMPFHVRSKALLAGLRAGDSVAFTLVVDRNASWVDAIRVVGFESAERDPALAGRLRTLDAVTRKAEAPPLAIGEKTGFRLIDQNKRPISLSDFEGKVVAINFIYTRCPLPDYCFRLSNNFAGLQKRFRSEDLILLTVTFDTAHDGTEELARYADVWKADSKRWHFLTGTSEDIQQVCARFGVQYWPDDGVFTHTLHAAILDREGKLVANLEGNKFTAEQLGDLVQTVLTGKR